ncbi:MAG: pyrroline-5-carboxylate reductase [Betaproteobacteria bacterium]|nr:pyrroline-5-carboxylate reductase [Betaproteobacteria bacterium]MBK7655902.1 pyrroline-5-carboxylate reductase [Betaproteobacteria bacterium]MBP6644329.1 pyrroline-5-carboxylate reductase [Burkholderiaceae bacterium]
MKFSTAFIGGGNMATAILGGMIAEGTPASQIWVVEPDAGTRRKLRTQFQVNVLEMANQDLAFADLVIWAVKPQVFKDAARLVKTHTNKALHLSVAAGIGSDSISTWLGTDRVVRAMPNTPALIGKGMTALYARAGVNDDERELICQVLGATGELIWVKDEPQLDAVTALSGSGPAYVFYFLEAMVEAGESLGLTREQAYTLALGTFGGATALAAQSDEPPAVLRQRVTSKGGTTYAAITSMERDHVKEKFIAAMTAACSRAAELGVEFGAT